MIFHVSSLLKWARWSACPHTVPCFSASGADSPVALNRCQQFQLVDRSSSKSWFHNFSVMSQQTFLICHKRNYSCTFSADFLIFLSFTEEMQKIGTKLTSSLSEKQKPHQIPLASSSIITFNHQFYQWDVKSHISHYTSCDSLLHRISCKQMSLRWSPASCFPAEFRLCSTCAKLRHKQGQDLGWLQ